MKKYKIFFSKQALKDVKSFSPRVKNKLKDILIEIISVKPYSGKKLLGTFKGNYSYRLSLKDRIIYSIDKTEGKVFIKRARSHYGG